MLRKKIYKSTILFLMATLLFSCVHRETINIDKVKNSNHGIVVMRPVSLNVHESAKNFYLGKFSSSKFANVPLNPSIHVL